MQNKTEKEILTATGRRKRAVARVRVIPSGKGKIVINGRDWTKYFTTVEQQAQIKRPLIVAELDAKADVSASVNGGGCGGQAGAVSLGIARCLLQWNAQLRSNLKKDRLLTRDPRVRERKKYGRKGARRRFQWTKR